MRLIRDLDQLPDRFRHAAVSIGNFDGVHQGHARIIERLVTLGRQVGGPAVVFTFDPHPARVLRPHQAPPPLSWTDRKAELLLALGADAVIAFPTDRALLQLEAREFFDQILRGRLAARALVEGPNFFFGHNRSGSIEVLGRFCAEADMVLNVVDPVHIGGQIVSSSRIRGLIAAGDVDQAAALLTRPHRIRGTVVHGAGRGAGLGFPTANLGQIDVLLPGEGIYAGRAWVDGSPWPAAMSIGPNPTFDEAAMKIEIFLVGYEGSLYEQTVEVDFLARLRDIETFDSVDQLVAQMRRDVDAAYRIVEQADAAAGVDVDT